MKKIVALVLSLVMVLGLATTAFAAGLNFYVVDSTDGSWELDTTTSTALAGKDLDDLMADDDEYLPCYQVEGYGNLVEVPEAQATYKLTYGAKTVYLTWVPETAVKFVAEPSVLTVVAEDDAECGDYFVINNTAYDEDDTYYVTYTKKGAIDQIFVADKTKNTNVLVGGKLVAVQELTFGVEIKFVNHVFKGYDVVNFAYTTVKCAECGKVANLYANATAAGKNAQKVEGGWITFADFMDFGAVQAPATDKVESAETFDAGIAMYVGMSVMAAAGSAVVLKKKD